MCIHIYVEYSVLNFLKINSYLYHTLQVESELFPAMRGQTLLLRSVRLDEALVTSFMDRAMDIFKANTIGPQLYLNSYKKYSDLLNGTADHAVSAFLNERHSLQGFENVSGKRVV